MKSFFKILCILSCYSYLSACIIQTNGLHQNHNGKLKDSCGFALSSLTGKGVHWPRSKFPISFYIHETVPFSAYKNFISAADHWNMSWEEYLNKRGLEYFPLFDIKNPNLRYSGNPGNDQYNMIYFVTEGFSKYGPDVQAITATYSNRNNQITDSDIIVNATGYKYFYDENYNTDVSIAKNTKQNLNTSYRYLASSMSVGFFTQLKLNITRWFRELFIYFKTNTSNRVIARQSNKVPMSHIDFASLMIHELGHVPGLSHVSMPNSPNTNSYSNSPSASRQNLYSRENTLKSYSVMEERLAYGRIRRAIQNYDLKNLSCGYIKSQN